MGLRARTCNQLSVQVHTTLWHFVFFFAHGNVSIFAQNSAVLWMTYSWYCLASSQPKDKMHLAQNKGYDLLD